VSLDSPNPVTEETMLDSMVDEESNHAKDSVDYKQSLQIEIERCLKTLSERERSIVRAFFGIGLPDALSLGEIALQHNMTGERVRQIKDKAITHLRNPGKSRLLKEYL
jgi:RNA polymerase primary sigma factor